MNVSFSTRGWQQIPWEQQVQMAETMRFGGIELYNVHKTPELTGRGGPLHRYTAAATARELWQKGLCIPCFDTACDIAGEDCTETVTALMQLAHDVQCPYVSVTAQRDDDARISAALEALLPAAEAQGITILLKTSGVFSDTARLRTLLDAFACDQLGALWDMHQPYRDHGESADTTIKNLGAYVRHVHLRDSDDDGSYDLIGEGTLPVGSMMQALSSIDYDGFISLEWKPEWMPDLTDPEVIFPHFVNYMHRFDSPRGKKKTLYDNAAHTGKFVWKKDSLISETFPQVLDRMVEEFPDQYAFKYTTLDYTADLCAVPRRRGRFCPRARLARRAPGQQGRHLGYERARMVHHLLGRDENRRRARHGQHGVQDPRGGISAAAVRHAYARHDRPLYGLELP